MCNARLAELLRRFKRGARCNEPTHPASEFPSFRVRVPRLPPATSQDKLTRQTTSDSDRVRPTFGEPITSGQSSCTLTSPARSLGATCAKSFDFDARHQKRTSSAYGRQAVCPSHSSLRRISSHLLASARIFLLFDVLAGL